MTADRPVNLSPRFQANRGEGLSDRTDRGDLMERVEHARADVEFATEYVLDTWTAVPALARLELRSATEALSALVPALDALARASEAFERVMREFGETVQRAGYRAGGA